MQPHRKGRSGALPAMPLRRDPSVRWRLESPPGWCTLRASPDPARSPFPSSRRLHRSAPTPKPGRSTGTRIARRKDQSELPAAVPRRCEKAARRPAILSPAIAGRGPFPVSAGAPLHRQPRLWPAIHWPATPRQVARTTRPRAEAAAQSAGPIRRHPQRRLFFIATCARAR